MFSRPECHIRKTNFCSRVCAGSYQSRNRSGKNHPMSKPIGSYIIKKDKSGRKRKWIKLAHPNTWEQNARYVWRTTHNKEIPYGYIIHHKNMDSMNDDPTNLSCITRSNHVNIHRKELYFKL